MGATYYNMKVTDGTYEIEYSKSFCDEHLHVRAGLRLDFESFDNFIPGIVLVVDYVVFNPEANSVNVYTTDVELSRDSLMRLPEGSVGGWDVDSDDRDYAEWKKRREQDASKDEDRV